MNHQPDPALVDRAWADQNGAPRPAAPVPHSSSTHGETFRYVVLVAVALVALAGLATAVLLLYPRGTPTVAAAQPAAAQLPVPVAPTVVQPLPTVYVQQPSTVTVVPRTVAVPDVQVPGDYSCGAAYGHVVYINNGNVPCGDALTVAYQWLSSGTTPGYGRGPAGTVNSWTCTTPGYCTSKMGSHLTVED